MTDGAPVAIHGVAVAIAIDPDGPLAGVLILGASNSGKSSLALSLIEACPFRRTALVADDVVFIAEDRGVLNASPARHGAGMIEIRGFGPVRVRSHPEVRIVFAVDLGARAERLPEPDFYRPDGFSTGAPFYPFLWKGGETTAAARLRRIAAAIMGGQILQATQDAPLGKGEENS